MKYVEIRSNKVSLIRAVSVHANQGSVHMYILIYSSYTRHHNLNPAGFWISSVIFIVRDCHECSQRNVMNARRNIYMYIYIFILFL